MKEKEYSVEGMHCAACKNNVECAANKVKGIKNAEVNLMSNSIKITYDEKTFNEKDLYKEVASSGYKLEDNYDEEIIFETKKDYKELIKIIIGIVLLIPLLFFGMGPMYSSIMPEIIKEPPFYLSNAIQYVINFIIIGLFFKYYKNGFLTLIKFKFNMDTLVFLGSLFSVIYSIYLTISAFFNHYTYEHFHLYLDSSAMILVFVSLGKYIENLSKNKAKSTIKALLDLRPKVAHKLENNEIIDINSKDIKLKDKLVVKVGETIPADGIILSGKTSIDESIISGESLPILKVEDDHVIGGSVNKEAPITILVNKERKDSVLNKIASLVAEASNMKTPLTEKVDKVAKIFTPTVMIIALIVFISWLIAGILNNNTPIISIGHFNSPFDEAFTFGVGVLVISCPCALGLATPISLLVGSSVFSKNYVLVQKSEGIEKVKDIDCLVLDKTNTITEGELSVSSLNILENSKSELLSKIYTIEKYSEHPIAKAISSYLKENNNNIALSSDFMMNETIPGGGIKATFKNNEVIFITNKEHAKTLISLPKEIENSIDSSTFNGELSILVYDLEGNIYALFYLKDKLKKEAKEFILEAKKHFKKIVLLTGDNKNIASYIAKEVGIESVISEVKPLDKDKEIIKLQNEGYKVMMVGDGVNDSIALTRADIGVSIAKGSDIAIASATFILMRNNLNDIFKILNISRRIRHNISFNLFWAFIYNIIFIPVAAGIFSFAGFILEPMYCAILMACSSVTVCLNALTLFIKRN